MTSNLYTQFFAAGTKIFAEGENGEMAYIIENGKVEISTVEHGNRVVLGTLSQGQLVGEMAMIDDAPRTATATAIQDTTLTIVSRDQLHERLDQAEPILRMLVNVLMTRYRSGLSRVKGTPLATQLNAPLPDDMMPDDTTAISKIRLESELKRALENDELEVFYQPLLGIADNKWAGFEALTRWQHPEKGAISPLQFITLAEETNLIIPIGLFVLQRACQDMVALQQQRDAILPGRKPLFVGVNVSSRQLGELDFLDKVADIAEVTGLPSTSLKLEITESMSVDYREVVKWVRCAREHGFTVAIDDFGTGYSSLEHLLELDVDTLKIDQAFVREMQGNEKAQKLVAGVASLAHELGYTIVAEGIETQQQLDMLARLGCEYGQGYLIGKPQGKDEVMRQIAAGA